MGDSKDMYNQVRRWMGKAEGGGPTELAYEVEIRVLDDRGEKVVDSEGNPAYMKKKIYTKDKQEMAEIQANFYQDKGN